MEMLSDFHNPVIFVSHNRDEVYRLAERIGSIESGMLSAVRDKKGFLHAAYVCGAGTACGLQQYITGEMAG